MRYLGLSGRKNILIPWITARMADSEKYWEFHDQAADSEKYWEFHDQAGDITCKTKCLFKQYLFLSLLQHEVSRTGRQKEHPDYCWDDRQ